MIYLELNIYASVLVVILWKLYEKYNNSKRVNSLIVKMKEKIGLDKFCDYLSKINMDFTDFILEDWESEEEGNVKLNGLTEEEWMDLYLKFLKKKFNKKL